MLAIAFPVHIDRPADEVFDYVTDPANLAAWQDTTVAVIPETDGPLAKGTCLREIRRGPFGREITNRVEISEFEPNRRFGLRMLSGPLPIHGEYTFHAVGSQTRLDFVAYGELQGPVRLMKPILRRLLRRNFERYHATLKRLLEES
jgi:ligand-binding SRPBCC domain-containing protein